MEKIDYINYFLQIFFINICMYYIYCRSINLKNNINKIITIIFFSTLIGITNTFLIPYVDFVIRLLILYFLYSVVLGYISKTEINYSVIYTIIAYCISYISYALSLIIAFVILNMLHLYITENNPLSFLFIMPVNIFLLFCFFKIKKFRAGLYFIKNTNTIRNLGSSAIFFGTIVLLLSTFSSKSMSDTVVKYFLFMCIIIAISIVIWLKTQMKLHYKYKTKDRTNEILENELQEKDKVIAELKNKLLEKSKTIHEINNRFSGYEHTLGKLLLQSETSFAPELSIALEDLKLLSKDFQRGLSETNAFANLPFTKIASMDHLFFYMSEKCKKNNIMFQLVITDSIIPLIDQFISKSQLETLLGDHIDDAIIAVNSSASTFRKIMVLIGLVKGCYEITFFDNGIAFEIHTLINLGLKNITTHANENGSGIGFMTTFETLQTCKASLIIEENTPKKDNSYTKSVIIRFDHKNQYVIRSYRFLEIEKYNQSHRIILEAI